MSQDELKAVRARVGSYFKTDKAQMSIKDQCVVNALCLSLAEVRMGTGITKITVVAAGEKISVTNDGPALRTDQEKKTGLPAAESLLTDLRSCHAHPGYAGFESALCAHGIATVNAVSQSARIITGSGSTAMVQKYSVGKPLGPFNEANAQVNGIRLDFELDKRWSGGGDFDLPAIEAHVHSIGVDLDGVELTLKAA